MTTLSVSEVLRPPAVQTCNVILPCITDHGLLLLAVIDAFL